MACAKQPLSQRCSRPTAAPSPRDGKRTAASFQAHWHVLHGTECCNEAGYAARLPRWSRRHQAVGATGCVARQQDGLTAWREAPASQHYCMHEATLFPALWHAQGSPCPSPAVGAQQLLPRAMAGSRQLPSSRIGMCYAA
ncbi:hypothetical protein HAX54_034269 [Datura stramonium]|uniref:Uncharacterized protein n=1 Tax=Datura stramonium TaxID=4076 RepID=A0ABS8VET5_DATST|nr:hypothetical protein [Datura stramonium]